MIKDKSHLDKIYILRAIGILRVFFYHAQLFLYPGYEVKEYNANHFLNITTTKNALLNLFPIAYGWTGIEVLILVSGFAIHWSFLSAKETINYSNFYSKRFWRLYPAYLLVIAFFCYSGYGLHYYFTSKEGLKDILAHLFLVHNLFNSTYFTINPSLWTLALEMQFYMIYPLFLYMRKKGGINKALLGSFLIGPISHQAVIFILGNRTGPAQSIVFSGWFMWCAGAFLAEKYFRGERVFGKAGIPVIIAGFTLTILSKFHFATYLYSNMLGTITWLAIMEWFLYTKKINTASLACKALSGIGLCSYSIYLIHQPFLHALLDLFSVVHIDQHFAFIKTIPALMIIVGTSMILYHYIEVPGIKFGSYLRRRKPVLPLVTPKVI